jgi:tetratricopeptide (TPR) repeat protein
MNKKIIFEYLRTIFRTILLVFIIVIVFVIIIQHQVQTEQKKLVRQEQNDTIDHSLIGMQISKAQYLEKEDPDNYKINLKLGILYEVQKDYKNAEIEYQAAVLKVPFGEYKPQYRLALLYIYKNKLAEAQSLMDNLGEHPDKKLINYKAEVYRLLGDKYYDMGDYENAISKYRKSLFYYQVIKSHKVNRVKGDLASSYLYFADVKVNEMQIDDAISYLQMAKALIDAPIIKYKLAVLLTTEKPDLAYQYFNEVFKEAPEIINYEDYYHLLSNLAQNAFDEGDDTLANLYEYKIKKLKEFANTNIIDVDALTLDNMKGSFFLNTFKTKYKIHFECIFNNHSKHDVDSLFLQIVFKTKERVIYIYSQQIFDENSIIAAESKSPTVDITASAKRLQDENNPDEMTVQVYVSKIQSSYKILLAETKIKKLPEKTMQIKLFDRVFYLPQIVF